jgi:transaldolase
LAGKGARVQRVLWASTSTKDPRESDVKYVNALIGPDTINTLPIETLDAFRDHGKAARWLDVSIPAAYRMLENLKGLGIDIDAITQQLEDEGVEKFIKAYDQLFVALREKQTMS